MMDERTNSSILSKPSGFTLVEMAIVLLIVGLLLGGLLPTISSQVEQRRVNETRRLMDEIQQALVGYAVIYKRLPCPAQPTIATGSANAGVMDCTITNGVVPWATLGISETDAWGRRFTYTVTNSFSTTDILLTSAGGITIKSSVGGTNVATGIPVVFVSHGTNGAGAYTSDGNQIPTSADADEAENANANTTFVNRDFGPTYDDLVTWVSPNTLFNRMVAAGKLP